MDSTSADGDAGSDVGTVDNDAVSGDAVSSDGAAGG